MSNNLGGLGCLVDVNKYLKTNNKPKHNFLMVSDGIFATGEFESLKIERIMRFQTPPPTDPSFRCRKILVGLTIAACLGIGAGIVVANFASLILGIGVSLGVGILASTPSIYLFTQTLGSL